MTKAEELRKQLDERNRAEHEEAARVARDAQQRTAREATRLVPMMFRTCIEACEKETVSGRNHANLTFDGYAAREAAERVVEKLQKENFNASYRLDSYGFRINSEGYVLSWGTPYVAFDISW